MTQPDPTNGNSEVSDEQFEEVQLASLRLDPENPRLPRDQDWSAQPEKQFLLEFYRRYNLIELAYSIADKGFAPRHAEALLVISHPDSPGVYIVVEGNRRLATLKLLTNADYRRHVGVKSAWDELAEQAASQKLDPVPVVVYHSREALNDYLGFRHITGPTPWRPEAKARFIARLLRAGESIGAVVRRIGSNHRTVRRFAEAHAIYTQALDNNISMDQVEAAFGVFYNALDQIGVRAFLGLGKQSEIQTLPEAPIPTSHLNDLKHLIELLYGDATGKLDKVIKESRDLRVLGEVLAHERGRRSLFMDRDLERAWRITGGGRQDLLALLESAHSRLAEANGQANEYLDDKFVLHEASRVWVVAKDMAKRFQLEQE